MIPSPAEAPDLYDDDDARPLRDGTSIQYEPPAWLKKKPEPPRDDA
jgi:hypothetical protein